MTAEQLKQKLIAHLRDTGYQNYISDIELYTQKVWEQASQSKCNHKWHLEEYDGLLEVCENCDEKTYQSY